MLSLTFANTLQLIVGLGLLNVWLLRASSPTRFRGGNANSLREEFAAYGMPPWSFYLVGALKVGAAVSLIAGLWVPQLTMPATVLIASLMIGAFAMHLKVRDPAIRSVPALTLLAMCTTLLVGYM